MDEHFRDLLGRGWRILTVPGREMFVEVLPRLLGGDPWPFLCIGDFKDRNGDIIGFDMDPIPRKTNDQDK